ncbi:hypothetical protein Tco_0133617 [Tanacetum coccineum]
MEAHLALNPHVQVKKVASSCKICSGPHNTRYCVENHEQTFFDYASSRSNEVGVTIIRKEDESREADAIETDATKDDDGNTVVEVEKKVEEGLDVSKPGFYEGESRDIKWHDLDDRTCGKKRKERSQRRKLRKNPKKKKRMTHNTSTPSLP